MPRWKISPEMAIWAVSFAVVATLSAIFLMTAVEGGFFAQGFFLIVITWILVLVLVAKLVSIVSRRRERKKAK